MASPEELLKKYHLSPPPENVLRLGQLITGFNKHVKVIAEIILADQAISNRVVRISTRGAVRSATPEEVESAVVRMGVDLVNMVLMTELAVHAIGKTFATMFNTALVAEDEVFIQENQIIGCIQFTGQTNGRIYLRVPQSASGWIVKGILGEGAPEDPSEMVCDVVGELLNMIGGNFKSNICDAGANCTLSVPSVQIQSYFKVDLTEDQRRETLYFHADQIPVLLDLVLGSITNKS
jgi:chemotaxis protein CheX